MPVKRVTLATAVAHEEAPKSRDGEKKRFGFYQYDENAQQPDAPLLPLFPANGLPVMIQFTEKNGGIIGQYRGKATIGVIGPEQKVGIKVVASFFKKDQ